MPALPNVQGGRRHAKDTVLLGFRCSLRVNCPRAANLCSYLLIFLNQDRCMENIGMNYTFTYHRSLFPLICLILVID